MGEMEGTRFTKVIQQLKTSTQKDLYIQLYNKVMEAKATAANSLHII